MSRNIAICIDKSAFRAIDGFNSVDINNLGNIINYSVGALVIDHLNIIDDDDIPMLWQEISSKMAVGGQIVMRFIDAKVLAQKFVDNIIGDKEFMNYISILKSVLTVDKIYNQIGSDFIVTDTDRSEIYTTIKVLRNSIS
jgi:hypothetical protein